MSNWQEENHHYLMAAIARVQAALEHKVNDAPGQAKLPPLNSSKSSGLHLHTPSIIEKVPEIK